MPVPPAAALNALPQVAPLAPAAPTPAPSAEQAPATAVAYSVTGDAHERWQLETKDPRWAPRFESEVRTIFRDAQLDSARLVDIDCRATLCRIEVAFDSMAAFQAVVRSTTAHAPLSRATGVSDIEAARAVTYLTPGELDAAG